MNPIEKEVLSSCLCLPKSITIVGVTPQATCLMIEVACHQLMAACPLCDVPSERIHDRYTRRVADVPCGGRRVLLSLIVRKFVCRTPTCPRKVFTEQIPDLVTPYARMTNRLVAVLQAIGLAAGGETGARLAAKVGIQTAPSTLLCHLMTLPELPVSHVRVLGIDDWCWKKRHRYGTLLVDLELNKIIDVLPDRKASTVVSWLLAHPEVEFISRDRGTDYTAAAGLGAPQAIQVVDRFHLVKNLADVLQIILARCRKEIRQAAQQEHPPSPQKVEQPAPPLPTPATWQQRTPPQVERRHQARQAERDDRFQQITELRKDGLTQQAVARRVGMAERSVRKWLKQETAPTWKRMSRRRSIFDPFAPYVLQRWQEGQREGKQLFEEIAARGFKGSIRVVQRFLQTLSPDPTPPVDLPPSSPAERFSTNTVVWLFIREAKDLSAQERIELFLLCQHSKTARSTYMLTQAFLTMVRERRGYEFLGWVDAVKEFGSPELLRFAYNLLKDYDAVKAGLTYRYSNGPVEALVHKLKLVKRQGYGRAKLPLLKQRLLHAL